MKKSLTISLFAFFCAALMASSAFADCSTKLAEDFLKENINQVGLEQEEKNEIQDLYEIYFMTQIIDCQTKGTAISSETAQKAVTYIKNIERITLDDLFEQMVDAVKSGRNDKAEVDDIATEMAEVKASNLTIINSLKKFIK